MVSLRLTDCLSAEALFRVWDVVLCFGDGSTFLFQVALALLKLNEQQLLGCSTPATVYTYINHQMTNHAISIDGLIQASEGLKRVVKREDVEVRRKLAVKSEQALVKEREDRLCAYKEKRAAAAAAALAAAAEASAPTFLVEEPGLVEEVETVATTNAPDADGHVADDTDNSVAEEVVVSVTTEDTSGADDDDDATSETVTPGSDPDDDLAIQTPRPIEEDGVAGVGDSTPSEVAS